ncbi:calvin cycle protein CP12-1, chloroplastic-like [Silene latifolia]|uniref:calvin cycle protein CP12-1, chloroplastic-like n=1 Tax=Silene latifolia TaxID=37657 RepID=UPI003D771ACE
MASLSFSLMSPKVFTPTCTNHVETPKLANMNMVRCVISKGTSKRLVAVRATPDKLSASIEQSIKAAQETCAEDPVSGECAAAWDEVEEVSAAASHARDKNKATDVLETYCKDNPETDECRTYDN